MLALNLFESLTPVSVQILTSLGYDDSNGLSSQHFSQSSFLSSRAYLQAKPLQTKDLK